MGLGAAYYAAGQKMATVAAPGGERWTDGMDESEKYAFVSSPAGPSGGAGRVGGAG